MVQLCRRKSNGLGSCLPSRSQLPKVSYRWTAAHHLNWTPSSLSVTKLAFGWRKPEQSMNPLLLDVGILLLSHISISDILLPGDETFDISVDKPLWLMISIRDRALVGKHDTVGRAYLCLDPKRFGDFLTHDVWMDLDSR